MTTKLVLHWLAFIIYCWIFGYAGIYKIVKVPDMMQGMASMGFGEMATLWIGWAETIGVAGLLLSIFIPAVRPVAVLWLWPFAIGALTAHFSYHHAFSDYRNALLVCIMPAVLLATDKHFEVRIIV